MMTRQERYRGALFGLAIGDALGTTLEFEPPGTFEPIDDMVGGGPFRLLPGQWTDDTSMALCLADSLVARRGFDPVDQLERYVRWFRGGYMSCTGGCFDIGMTVRAALLRFEETGASYCGSRDPMSAGNGSLMRLVPVPMAYASHPARAISYAADSSRTTHAAVEAVDACRYYGGLIVGALNGAGKEELLGDRYAPVEGIWEREPLAPGIERIARGSFKHRDPPEIRGRGYVADALEAALWAFHRGGDFREGALMAVNLGDDADTTGAIYGQLAGAFHGVDAIPGGWRHLVARAELIELLADRLLELADEIQPDRSS